MSSPLWFLFVIVLFPHAFVEYSLHIQVDYNNQVYHLSELLFENVTKVYYSNSTFVYNLTVYVLNFSQILTSSAILDNFSLPKTFFYIPNPGEPVVERSVILSLLSSNDSNYIYYGKTFIGYVELEYFYYVNSTGVPYKIIILQIGESGQLVSNTTYILVKSNLVNPNEQPILPEGFKIANGSEVVNVPISLGLNSALDQLVGKYISFVTLLLVFVFLTVRFYASRKKTSSN
ncbi:hypothetical protein SULI_01770 [Saccharolobus solfataricus]|uniref:Uncharacterized protein n=3 Tax=Saccharolobus solfataricus TaxID=2287 RepID=Q97VR6_SACS2|nr:hypothetical protein [Saccharolobus solfataricus]AAK42675.1 Hypothetical protein SSO2546 [Saccharolobus solfataricus P2]AKA72770.1 hypothetical protein SULB_0348 [Saccharolobus solfataricus]AKA75469.1 hypothetical protein SULC_0346 [Saccharolobus solfataricus]AKA78162.1 hypothetical protein SULA_0346 [Saccharolobus solfataricus]AZF67280.1 hypothetical protein SULG_01770 [Saccharolobus solfataricus]